MAIIKKSGGVMSTTPRPSEAAKEAAKDAPKGPSNKKFIGGIPSTGVVVNVVPGSSRPGSKPEKITKTPLYEEGAESSFWGKIGPEQRDAYKKAFIQLGLYPDNYMPARSGVPTETDVAALKEVMTYANFKGINVDEALTDPNLSAYILENKKYKTGSGGDKTYTVLTPKEAAAAELVDQFRTVFNTDPTAKQINLYANALNNLEKDRSKVKVNSSGQVVTTQGLTQQEREDLLMQQTQMAATEMFEQAKKIGSSDADALNQIAKGQLGSTITALRNTYMSNGIPMPTTKELYKVAVSSLYNKDVLNNNIDLIRQQASMYFPALKDKIVAGYNVKDLLAPYINIYSRTLEKPAEGMDLQSLSKVASDPTGKLMPLRDYQISLRKLPDGSINPEWAVTQDAHDTFSNAASAIIRGLGLVR